jgi:hypothetical protein
VRRQRHFIVVGVGVVVVVRVHELHDEHRRVQPRLL